VFMHSRAPVACLLPDRPRTARTAIRSGAMQHRRTVFFSSLADGSILNSRGGSPFPTRYGRSSAGNWGSEAKSARVLRSSPRRAVMPNDCRGPNWVS
jgi:hypothetical protein